MIGTAAALGLAGLAAGAGKYAIEKGEANAQRRRAAEANRYSPWTGHQVAMPKDPSLASDLLQGGAMGVSLGSANPNLFSWGKAAASSAAPALTGNKAIDDEVEKAMAGMGYVP